MMKVFEACRESVPSFMVIYNQGNGRQPKPTRNAEEATQL